MLRLVVALTALIVIAMYGTRIKLAAEAKLEELKGDPEWEDILGPGEIEDSVR